ncbi:MAG: carbamate kinase [Thermotogaceae bacterium]|jgi:carbamate kinase|nr:carbamate kinase [Thermotogaceae bacterium]
MKKTAVVAIGGNAIQKKGEKPTSETMLKNLETTSKYLVEFLADEYKLVITHGNGPQVGNLLLQQECAKDFIPPFPIDVNDAQTQGSIGYMISQSLINAFIRNGKRKSVCTVITQILVDPNDQAFQNPTKPIGPFYEKEEAEKLAKEKGWKMFEDAGRGYRRVVPSPKPLDIVEIEAIKALLATDTVVIAAGGGGIPVFRTSDNVLKGVEAVIDKDRASALLAKLLNADILLILTAVEKVFLNFGKPEQKPLDILTTKDAKKYLNEGHFPKGSMGPKIEAAIDFVEATGRECIITSIEKVKEALIGNTGTRIIP